MITRENYEIYAIDYLEGKLDKKLKAEFEKFLEANPDIKEEITGLTQTVLSKETHTFPEKWQLKKSSIESLTYTDELFISDVEGIATQVQKKEIVEITKQYPHLRNEYQAYQATRLEAPTVFYPHKDKLKKTPVEQTIRKVLAYAAVIVLAMTIFTLWQKPDKNIAASLSIPRYETNLLTPAGLTIPEINRPVVVVRKKQEKHTNTTSSKPIKQKTEEVITNISSPKKQQTINIASKEFCINQEITQDIDITFEQNLPLKYQNLILAKNISSTFRRKINKWARERGIIVSRNQFIIRINNKSYGISIAGR